MEISGSAQSLQEQELPMSFLSTLTLLILRELPYKIPVPILNMVNNLPIETGFGRPCFEPTDNSCLPKQCLGSEGANGNGVLLTNEKPYLVINIKMKRCSLPSCGATYQLFCYELGLFNVRNKVLVALDICLEWRELFKAGMPLHKAIEAKLKALQLKVSKGSFFEGSKLHLWQIIGLTYFWSLDCGRTKGLSQKQVLKQLEIKSEHTVVDWKQFCRDVCLEHFLNNPQQIDGPGRIVEIDESLFAKRKYNCGRILSQNWIFGGYDPVDKKGFQVPVPRRDAVTLPTILQTWVVLPSYVQTCGRHITK
eukprot:gene9846-18425_t